MRRILSLAKSDFKNIKRDPMVGNFAILPIYMFLLIMWLVPALTTWLMNSRGFNLEPYYPAIVGYFFVLLSPLQMGVVAGFLLLDEKDENILTALRVTPLPLSHYAIYRIFIITFLSFFCVMVLMPLTGLVNLSPEKILPAAIAAGLAGPVFALCIASFAGNKVEGFALSKGLGFLAIVPIVAFFIKSNWQFLFGIFPTYWPVKAFWVAAEGGKEFWLYSAIGILYFTILLIWLLRKFAKKIA